MKLKLLKWMAAGGGLLLLAACAVITVNVYFPEKAAKEAYKSLDEMLLKEGDSATPGKGAPPAPSPAPEAKPVSLWHRLPLSLVAEAHAAQDEGEALAVELSSMPEVLEAYEEMNGRLARVTSLLDSGAAGITNQGLLTLRDPAKAAPQDDALLKAENISRKTVVTSMAKAILKLNKQPVSKEAMDKVMGKAAATFADTKREAAKPGWWVQLANGRWVQK